MRHSKRWLLLLPVLFMLLFSMIACGVTTQEMQRQIEQRQGEARSYAKVEIDGVECIVYRYASTGSPFSCNWDAYNAKEK